MKSKLFALLILVLAAVPATSAAQWSIQVTVRSYHIERNGYHEWNWGIGVGYDVGPVDIEVGGYINSHKDPVGYAEAVRSLPEHGVIGAELGVGTVIGYEKQLIRPLLTPGVYVGKNPRFRIIGIPSDGGVIGSQIKYFVP